MKTKMITPIHLLLFTLILPFIVPGNARAESIVYKNHGKSGLGMNDLTHDMDKTGYDKGEKRNENNVKNMHRVDNYGVSVCDGTFGQG